MPLYLLAGTFFPLTSLPVGLQAVAWVSPLWHGVQLCRGFTQGQSVGVVTVMHVGYLVVWIVVGGVLAVRMLRRRLRS